MVFGASYEPLFHIGPVPVYDHVVAQWIVLFILAVICIAATRNMQVVPRGLQNFFEWIVEWCYNFFGGALGSEHAAKRYTPLLATFFLFILTSNYFGLIPGAGTIHGFVPPTSDWNITGTLATIVFFSVLIAGFREQGGHYLAHFVSPHWLFLPMNILEQFARPLSLTLRLFGNIFGHEMIVAFLVLMAPFLVPMPLQALGVLTGLIQALVFTILATSYLADVVGEGHH